MFHKQVKIQQNIKNNITIYKKYTYFTDFVNKPSIPLKPGITTVFWSQETASIGLGLRHIITKRKSEHPIIIEDRTPGSRIYRINLEASPTDCWLKQLISSNSGKRFYSADKSWPPWCIDSFIKVSPSKKKIESKNQVIKIKERLINASYQACVLPPIDETQSFYHFIHLYTQPLYCPVWWDPVFCEEISDDDTSESESEFTEVDFNTSDSDN